MEFMQKHHVQALCLGSDGYPLRLSECPDAPLVLYYLGNAQLNRRRVINIVGTRRCTTYGQDIIRRFVSDLRQQCPEVLIVSGLAYGIDICAHRHALEQGLDTARQMIGQGGLLTEYMTETAADKMNFVRRNRIVAGISDATILVESAAKGGGLITCRIALDYDRAVFAFPGAVGAPYSEGCNNLIRDNGAQLITSAQDFINAMGWQGDAQLQKAKNDGIERDLFPNLSPDERRVAEALSSSGDLQLNQLAVKTNITVGQLTALLFQLEMKGVVRPLAGGTYHLLS